VSRSAPITNNHIIIVDCTRPAVKSGEQHPCVLWQSRAADLIRFLERWLLSDPLGRRPVLVLGVSDIAYLHQLLGIAEGGAVFPEINRLLTAAVGQGPALLLAPT